MHVTHQERRPTLLERAANAKSPAPGLAGELGLAQPLGNLAHHLHVDTLSPALLVSLSFLGIRKSSCGDLKENNTKRVRVHVLVVALACEQLGLADEKKKNKCCVLVAALIYGEDPD